MQNVTMETKGDVLVGQACSPLAVDRVSGPGDGIIR